MANHLSALKRARQTTKRTAINRANTSTLRTQLRDLRETIEKGDKAAAEQSYRKTVSALDKAIQKGTLHENTASRYKSRLGKRVSAIKVAISRQPSEKSKADLLGSAFYIWAFILDDYYPLPVHRNEVFTTE